MSLHFTPLWVALVFTRQLRKRRLRAVGQPAVGCPARDQPGWGLHSSQPDPNACAPLLCQGHRRAFITFPSSPYSPEAWSTFPPGAESHPRPADLEWELSADRGVEGRLLGPVTVSGVVALTRKPRHLDFILPHILCCQPESVFSTRRSERWGQGPSILWRRRNRGRRCSEHIIKRCSLQSL